MTTWNQKVGMRKPDPNSNFRQRYVTPPVQYSFPSSIVEDMEKAMAAISAAPPNWWISP